KRGRPQWTSYRGRLRTRLLAGDHMGAWNVAEQALASGASPTDVYVDVLGPVLEDIGTRWERGSLTVGEEHRASAAARLVVGRMSPRFARRGRTRGTVVLGAASGDTHGLPLAMVADVLRGAAFDVVDLGADTPAESFVQMIQRTDAVALGISASTDGAVDAVAKTIRAVREAHPDIPIMVGGPAFPTAADAEAVGADGWAPDAREVPTVVENLLAEANQA
ncbi:MAG TPA: cobalamin-dependent protein, partial [Acidimicrobiia bacterium]|nr:cobalamin-dependent protein [Acidimicrobiia bacterium]